MDQLVQDLTTLQTALTAVQADVQGLVNDTTSTDPNDAVVSAFVSALTSAGWTVTPPAAATAPATTQIPVTDAAAADAPELPEGDVSTPSTEA